MYLVEQVEIYRIAIACGIYSKRELSEFLDKIIVDLEEPPYEIIDTINYLSDGLYLAKERIYGEVEDIKQNFIKFISQYQFNND
ncbi:hypothetical protein GKZ28_06710 [Clostridium chromiireducens]|uniref:Uncharacterized protein n=1 Tax=Clostridium chromiireducens TaxID=225345 RepID=A0A964W1Q2_9CLOT|nr:hypothetical protein [Clostridium chromiireducens]MVX63385.1 hypothetical protein [Clostridium chromiireducens]